MLARWTLCLCVIGLTVHCSDDDGPAADGQAGVVERDLDTTGLDQGDPAPEPPGLIVYAAVETEPVVGPEDAADDPAIWVNPAEPTQSLVIGTDKTSGGGLFSYELDGSLFQALNAGALNNVDLRQGFELGGQEVTLVTATNRTDDTLAIFALDHETRLLSDVAARPVATLADNYGLCMYRSVEGEFYAFVNHQDGTYQQFRLFEQNGQVDAELVRTFCVQTQPEGCVADDEAGLLYVGEESFGIWKFAADPDGTPPGNVEPDCAGALAGEVVDEVSQGVIVADVEGLAIADTGNGEGYLIASSQGANAYVIYDRQPPHAHLHTFQIWGGGPTCLDGASETDGLEVTTADLGGAFSSGLLVVQDGINSDPPLAQNFKLVPLADVLSPLEAPVENAECRVGDYGGSTQDDELPDGPERTEAFCQAFCDLCQECYDTAADIGFAEGDCHYESPKPTFMLDDCLTGCAAGAVPSSTGPLQPGWETWECLALDEAL